MRKKGIEIILLCLVLGVSFSACKKETDSKKDEEAVSDEQDKEQDTVSVIIKENEEEKEEANPEDGTDAWEDVEIELSDSSDSTQTETMPEQTNQDKSSSKKEETTELPDYYPGAY